MFRALGYGSLSVYDSISVCSVYRLVIEDTFLKAKIGPEVAALRRAARAFLVDNMTPEFDALILQWL